MLHFKWSIYEVEFNKFIMKQKKIKEMAIKPLKQKQLTALALAFAACSAGMLFSVAVLYR